MREFKCKLCLVNCVVKIPYTLRNPIYCPIGGACEWEEVVVFGPCPFCGETDSVEFHKSDKDIDSDSPAYYTVNCNLNKGGCGAQSGYDKGKAAAAERWNERDYDPDY